MTLMQVVSYGTSDIGLVRKNNEDVWAELPEKYFYVLADGMGGHRAGEVAAFLAVISLCQTIKELPDTLSTHDRIKELKKGIQSANSSVYAMASQDEKLQGMGTTLCCLFLSDRTLIYANVGDSRIYQWRGQQLFQLSRDHSLRSELIAKGELLKDSLSPFPYKNVITRSIGTTPKVEPDIATLPVHLNDIYFLCSDGLTDALSDIEIAEVLDQSQSIKQASDILIEKAKQRGGNDNITIVMVKYEADLSR